MNQGVIFGSINIPFISIIKDEYFVIKSIREFTICRAKYIKELNGIDEKLIDCEGILYKRGFVKKLKPINVFGGFSLKHASYGVVYVEKEIEKTRELSIDELKKVGEDLIEAELSFFENTLLPIDRMRKDFIQLSFREDVLRYLFYFASTEQFNDPMENDKNWRQGR